MALASELDHVVAHILQSGKAVGSEPVERRTDRAKADAMTRNDARLRSKLPDFRT
jgi:hypothetical protein